MIYVTNPVRGDVLLSQEYSFAWMLSTRENKKVFVVDYFLQGKKMIAKVKNFCKRKLQAK